MARRAAHLAEYALFRGAEAALARLSWSRRAAVGAALGRFWYWADPRHRRVALENVRIAFPDWEGARVEALVRRSFAHLGVTAAEFLSLGSQGAPELLAHCRLEGLEHLEAAASLGRGVLLLTGHVGNWELGGHAMAARRLLPIYAVGRRLSNPYVDRRVREVREHHGGALIPHRKAVGPVLRALRGGGAVAFLMDQRPRAREAVPSRFFGRPVATNPGLAILALKTGAPVVPGFDARLGGEHVVRFEAALPPPSGDDRPECVRRFTEAFDATIEAAVRRNPEQWLWVHRRWQMPSGMAP